MLASLELTGGPLTPIDRTRGCSLRKLLACTSKQVSLRSAPCELQEASMIARHPWAVECALLATLTSALSYGAQRSAASGVERSPRAHLSVGVTTPLTAEIGLHVHDLLASCGPATKYENRCLIRLCSHQQRFVASVQWPVAAALPPSSVCRHHRVMTVTKAAIAALRWQTGLSVGTGASLLNIVSYCRWIR